VGGLSVGWLVTCEHASHAFPAPLENLGLPIGLSATHFGWDRGAREIARTLASRLGCPYFEGRFSRLVVDLNRSIRHPRVIPPDTAGVDLVSNRTMDRTQRQQRLARWWLPHVEAVRAAADRSSHGGRRCVHIAVHSFTPVLGGEVRDCDVGILFDPASSPERALAGSLREAVAEAGLKCRFNYPYRGASDGLVTSLRKSLGKDRYLGFEIEINQAMLADPKIGGCIADSVATGLKACFQR